MDVAMITVEAAKIMIIIIIEDQTALDRDFKKTTGSLIIAPTEVITTIDSSKRWGSEEMVTSPAEDIIIVTIIGMKTGEIHTVALSNSSIDRTMKKAAREMST